MVKKKGATTEQEHDDQTKELIEDLLWQKNWNEQEIKNVHGKLKNIKGGSAERTIQEYDKGFREKGLIPEGKEDYPIDQFIALGYLREFDSRVDPSTIKKKITNMIIEPVSIKQNGKLVTKHALTINGKYEGYNHAGVRMVRGWSEGWYLVPEIRFMVNSKTPFDAETGKPVGENKVMRSEKIHTIFAPEELKARRKLYESIISESDTLADELSGRLMYRQSDGGRVGTFTFDQFCDLPFDQLRQIQKTGYYTDTKGTLRNTEGVMVEYNRSTRKVEAIQ
jgi:hypothetical protein